MSQTPSSPLGTLGEQIIAKQSQLQTRQPTAKEIKKAGGQQLTLNKPLPTRARGFSFKPAEKKVQVTYQSEEIRQQTAADIKTFQEQVGPYMHDAINDLFAYENLSQAEKANFAGQHRDLKDEILDTLNQPSEYARELALVAYADAIIQYRLDNQPKWDNAKEALADLSSKDFLVSADLAKNQKPKSDQLRFGSKVFSLALGLKSNLEAVQVFEKMDRLVRAVYDEAQQYAEDREQTVKELAGSPETQLTIEELTTDSREGPREGFLYLVTPFQEWTSKFTKDGEPKTQTHHRGPGGITIQTVIIQTSRGPKTRVVLVDGHGGIERDCQRILNAEVFITPRSLLSDNFVVPENLDPEKQIAARILHRMIRLGITRANEFKKRQAEKERFRSECDKERQKLVAKETIPTVDFYAREAGGDIVVEWETGPFKQVTWHGKNKPSAEKLVWFVMALVGRDEQGRIGVKDCPERLNGFFAPHREFIPPGQDFSRLGKLGVILRQARERLLKGITPEKLEESHRRALEIETARKVAEAQSQQELAAQFADSNGEKLDGISIPDPTEGRE